MAFKTSIIVSICGLGFAFLWGGFYAFFLALTLSLLEIGLSFDNAILNAVTLKDMDKVWQERFLYWGILIAVFVVRFWLPLFVVALQSDHSMISVLRLGLEDPTRYAILVGHTKPVLFSFGGIFLLLVFVDFLVDPQTQARWFPRLEKKTIALGKRFPLAYLLFSSLILALRCYSLPRIEQLSAFYSGLLAIGVFLLLKKLRHAFKTHQQGLSHHQLAKFFYLEVLDASFSLDGVITAFAITQDLMIIFIGLTIGAVFVRSMTIAVSKKAVLTKYRYLEHGAHYALGILAIVLLMDASIHVPGWITGILSIGIIAWSLYSSIYPLPQGERASTP